MLRENNNPLRYQEGNFCEFQANRAFEVWLRRNLGERLVFQLICHVSITVKIPQNRKTFQNTTNEYYYKISSAIFLNLSLLSTFELSGFRLHGSCHGLFCFALYCFQFLWFFNRCEQSRQRQRDHCNYTKISHNGTEYSEQYILLLGNNSLILLKF